MPGIRASQPVLLVDEALAPALEGGGRADWGVVHSGQSSDEEEDDSEDGGGMRLAGAASRQAHPSAVVVGLVRRARATLGRNNEGGEESFDVRGVVEAADAVLRALGALPPAGSMLGGGAGKWWAQQWAAAVSAVGLDLATALAWPAVVTRAVSASKLAAAEAVLAGAAGGASAASLLRSSLWAGLVERWRSVARLQRRLGTLGFMALGDAGSALADSGAMRREAKAAEKAGVGLREQFAAVSTVLMAETDAAVAAAMAVGVASHHAAGGCGEWVESAAPWPQWKAVGLWWQGLVSRPEGWLGAVGGAGALGLLGGAVQSVASRWREQQRLRWSKGL